MKKLIYLFVAGTMFAFTACNCGTGDDAATDAVEEVVACADDCQKACCLGCQAEGGGACLADHSCCAVKVESTEGEEATEEGAEKSHEGHDHEGHDHEGHGHEGHDHE